MRRMLTLSVAAALLAALPLPAGADCAEDLEKLARARQKAANLRARLRAMLLAGSTDTSEVEKPLAEIDAQADRLRTATKGCKPAHKRRPRRRPKALPRVRPKARAPAPAGPSAKVVLTPDTIQARLDPCADLLARAAATAPSGSSARAAHGAAGAWSERHRRHEVAHRAEAWSRELIERCRRAGERR